MKHCSVWSEPECNSGVRLAELPNVLPGSSFSESITGDRGTCTILLSINDRAVQLGYVAIYNVIRIVDDDDTVYEYRIQGLDDEAGTKSVRVTGSSLITDLGRVLIYQVAGGTTTFDFAVSDQSMASYITNYVLPAMTANGMGYFSLGSVDAALPTVSLTWSNQTPLSLLNSLQQQLSCEVWLTRNGASGYYINAGQRTDATRPRFEVGVNVEALTRSIIADEKFISRAWTKGVNAGTDTVASTVESAVWRVSAINGATITLENPSGGSAPIVGDDQFNNRVAFFGLDPVAMPFQDGVIATAAAPQICTSSRMVPWYPPIWDSVNSCYWTMGMVGSDTASSDQKLLVFAKYVPSTRTWTYYRPWANTFQGSYYGYTYSVACGTMSNMSLLNNRMIFRNGQDSPPAAIYYWRTDNATFNSINGTNIINVGGTNYSISSTGNRTGDGKYCLCIVYDGASAYRLCAVSLDGGTHRDLGDYLTIFGGSAASILYYEPTNGYYWLFCCSNAQLPLCWNGSWVAQTVSWGSNFGHNVSSYGGLVRSGNRLYMVNAAVYNGQWSVVPDITSLAAQTCLNSQAITGTLDTSWSYANNIYPKNLPDTQVMDQPSNTAGRVYFPALGTKNSKQTAVLVAVDFASGSNSVAYVGGSSTIRLHPLVQNNFYDRCSFDTTNNIIWNAIGLTNLPMTYSPAALSSGTGGALDVFIKSTINDTVLATQQIVLAASDSRIRVGMWVWIRADSTGTGLQAVESGASISAYGVIEGRPQYRLIGRSTALYHGGYDNTVATPCNNVPMSIAAITVSHTMKVTTNSNSIVDADYIWSKADATGNTSYACNANGAQSALLGSIALKNLPVGLVLQVGDSVNFTSPTTFYCFVRKRAVVNGSGQVTVAVTYTYSTGTIADNSSVTVIKRDLSNVPTGGRALVLMPQTGGNGSYIWTTPCFQFAVPLPATSSKSSYWVTVWYKMVRASTGAGGSVRCRVFRWDTASACDEVAGTGTPRNGSAVGEPIGGVMSVQYQITNDPQQGDQWLLIDLFNNSGSGQIDGPVFIEAIVVHQGDTAHTSSFVTFGANELYATTARALATGRGQPTISYTVKGPKNGIVLGATALLYDRDRGIADVTPRIVQVVRPILKNGVTGTPEISLDNRDLSLVDAILALGG